MKDERQRFLEEEWPKVYATIQRLGLSTADLLRNGAAAPNAPYPTTPGQGNDKGIEARGLKKSYHTTHALEDVSFTVEPGRIVGLIGPNGAGKTTALKAILGLTRFEGELRVLGLDPRSQRDELMRSVSSSPMSRCCRDGCASARRWISSPVCIPF